MTPWRKERLQKLNEKLIEVRDYKKFFAKRGLPISKEVWASLETKEEEAKEEILRLKGVVTDFGLSEVIVREA